MRHEQVIIEPVLTEKSNALRETEVKKYTFRVHPDASKFQIADAVAALFNVTVTSCNVMNVKSKPRNARTRRGIRRGKTASWKKALVTLKAGQSIEVLEGV